MKKFVIIFLFLILLLAIYSFTHPIAQYGGFTGGEKLRDCYGVAFRTNPTFKGPDSPGGTEYCVGFPGKRYRAMDFPY